MKEFWNERYSKKQYAYGTEPNSFFAASIQNLAPGRILLPAEGEGRNAVYAASLGWEVYAFDFSPVAKEKALYLAKNENVSIYDYSIATYEEYAAGANSFDCIGLIYAHMNNGIRMSVHRKLLTSLKPGGTLILEAFSKEQLKNNSGGPKDEKMLYSMPELQQDFAGMTSLEINALQLELSEGACHNGKSDIIRLSGIK